MFELRENTKIMWNNSFFFKFRRGAAGKGKMRSFLSLFKKHQCSCLVNSIKRLPGRNKSMS